MSVEVCGVDSCLALASSDDGLCAVHAHVKRVRVVLLGTKCPRCGCSIQAGEWVTREASASTPIHAVCPLSQPRGRRKRAASTPLFEVDP